MNPTHDQTTPGRRRFFGRMAGDACSIVDEARGVPQLRLDDLPQLPDGMFLDIIPAVAAGVRLSYADGFVVAAVPGIQKPVRLFPTDSGDLPILCQFRGDRPVGAIADEVAGSAAAASRRAEAFRRVRSCFLRLVAARVCVPTNAVS